MAMNGDVRASYAVVQKFRRPNLSCRRHVFRTNKKYTRLPRKDREPREIFCFDDISHAASAVLSVVICKHVDIRNTAYCSIGNRCVYP